MKIGPLNISWNSEKRESYYSSQDLGKFVSCLVGGYSEENMIKLFMSIPEVFSPIDTIASAVCSANWELRRISDDEVVSNNSDWNALFERPNWKQDWRKLIYNAVVYKYTTGNRFIYTYIPESLAVKMKNIVNLFVLPSQYTAIKIKTERPNFLVAQSSNDLIEYYDFSAGRDRAKIKPDYVIHEAFIDVKSDSLDADIVRGVSPLASCEYPMSNIMAVYEARNVIYVKRGSLGFMVSKVNDGTGLVALTPAEKKEALEDYANTYGLNRKKNLVGISRFPLEFIKTAMSISELEPFKETDASSDALYAALRVPRELKPRPEGATYENQQKAERRLYTHVAIPEANQLAALIGCACKLKELGLYLYPSFEHIEALQDDKKLESEVGWKNNETLRVRFLNGVITLNMWIVEAGYEAVTGVPLYDKRIFQMDENERAIIQAFIKAGANQNANNNGNETGTSEGK